MVRTIIISTLINVFYTHACCVGSVRKIIRFIHRMRLKNEFQARTHTKKDEYFVTRHVNDKCVVSTIFVSIFNNKCQLLFVFTLYRLRVIRANKTSQKNYSFHTAFYITLIITLVLLLLILYCVYSRLQCISMITI